MINLVDDDEYEPDGDEDPEEDDDPEPLTLRSSNLIGTAFLCGKGVVNQI